MWLYLTLASAALFGVTSIVDKFVLSRLVRNQWVYYLWWGIYSVALAPFLLIFSPGSLWMFNLPAFLSGIVIAFSGRIYLYAVGEEEISRVVPLIFVSPLFVLILSIAFLGENPTLRQIGGILALIAGAVMISMRNIEQPHVSRGALFALGAAVFSAIAGILYKLGTLSGDIVGLLFWNWIAYGIVSLALSGRHWPEFVDVALKLSNKARGLLVTTAVLANGAIIIGTFAWAAQAASLVAAVSATQPFFVFIYSLIASIFIPHLFREEMGRGIVFVKFIAILTIIAGVALVS